LKNASVFCKKIYFLKILLLFYDKGIIITGYVTNKGAKMPYESDA